MGLEIGIRKITGRGLGAALPLAMPVESLQANRSKRIAQGIEYPMTAESPSIQIPVRQAAFQKSIRPGRNYPENMLHSVMDAEWIHTQFTKFNLVWIEAQHGWMPAQR